MDYVCLTTVRSHHHCHFKEMCPPSRKMKYCLPFLDSTHLSGDDVCVCHVWLSMVCHVYHTCESWFCCECSFSHYQSFFLHKNIHHSWHHIALSWSVPSCHSEDSCWWDVVLKQFRHVSSIFCIFQADISWAHLK